MKAETGAPPRSQFCEQFCARLSSPAPILQDEVRLAALEESKVRVRTLNADGGCRTVLAAERSRLLKASMSARVSERARRHLETDLYEQETVSAPGAPRRRALSTASQELMAKAEGVAAPSRRGRASQFETRQKQMPGGHASLAKNTVLVVSGESRRPTALSPVNCSATRAHQRVAASSRARRRRRRCSPRCWSCASSKLLLNLGELASRAIEESARLEPHGLELRHVAARSGSAGGYACVRSEKLARELTAAIVRFVSVAEL